MGEYAIRKSDRERIKIGSCEDLWYLRFEDRHRVDAEPNNTDPNRKPEGSRFRLPFPDEDNKQPGDYFQHNRGLRLYRKRADGGHDDFTDPKTMENPHTIQLKHDCGLLINMPCFHGHKLPDATPDMGVFWNGKTWHLELSSLRCVRNDDGRLQIFPVVTCRFCTGIWRYTWDDVMDFIEPKMRARLERYREPFEG